MLTHARRPEGQTSECKLKEDGILATQTHGLKHLQNILQLEISVFPGSLGLLLLAFSPSLENPEIWVSVSAPPFRRCLQPNFENFMYCQWMLIKIRCVCLLVGIFYLLLSLRSPFANPHACVSGGSSMHQGPVRFQGATFSLALSTAFFLHPHEHLAKCDSSCFWGLGVPRPSQAP